MAPAARKLAAVAQGAARIADPTASGGTVYNLHNRTGASTQNIDKTYSVNLSSDALNGAWTLRVADRAARRVGRIDA